LVTLTGPGGIGKSRLAIAVLHAVRGLAGDGVPVFLAGVRDPRLVGSSVLAALGRRVDARLPVFEQLVGELGERELLIVLDNFEQLLPAAPMLTGLLGAAPGLKLLVTSRVRLRVVAEHELSVGPLAHDDAVGLFSARARAANAEFELSAATAADVSAVCERLEGVPLALELAAARLRVLAPRELLERLGERLAYLTGGPRDAPARHRTLRATLDWSYELLNAAARELLARLSVFQDGFTVEAARAVCAPPGTASDAELLDALGLLVDHSLLRHAQDTGDPAYGGRFWMLETVREYAGERLVAMGEADVLAARHARYFAALAERGKVGLLGSAQPRWLARLQAELSNLRAALTWALPDNNPQLGLQLAAALGQRFWDLHGYHRDDARWLELALASAPQPSRDRAQALAALAAMTWRWNLEDATAHAEQAVALADQIDEPRLLAWCNIILAIANARSGEQQLADRHFEQAARLAALAGDRRTECIAIHNRANLALGRAQYDRARQFCEQAIAIDADTETLITVLLLCVLSVANVHLGHAEDARRCLRDAAAPARQIGSRAGAYLHACAIVIARVGSAERAARLLGQEESLRESGGWDLDATDRRLLTETLEVLQAKLYPAVLASAWERGRAMSLEDAFAEISEELDRQPPTDPPPPVAPPDHSQTHG
jgi:predicted ATPase